MKTIRLTVEFDIEEDDFEEIVGNGEIIEQKRKEWDKQWRDGLPEEVKELRTNIEVVK
jgi:hypothetical protein